MTLLAGHKANFETLQRAVTNGDAALIDCVDVQTREQVAVVCAANRLENGDFEFVPLARLFQGDPYAEIYPPGHPENLV
jgi:hypothetical protein